MMNKSQNPKWKSAAGLASAALLAFASYASADVLFTDNFNILTGADANNANNNLNVDLADRQAGPLAPVTYTGVKDHHQVGNTATEVGQPGGAVAYGGGYVLTADDGKWQCDLDVAGVSAGPLTIEFDYFITRSDSRDWGAFSLRAPGDTWAPGALAGEFGMLMRHDGGMQVFQNGGTLHPASWDVAGFAMDSHWKLIFTDTAGTGSAFKGNGSQVTFINGTTTLGTITLGQLNRSGLKFGFGDLPGGSAYIGIDNIAVSGTPSAIVVTATNQTGAKPFIPSYTLETPNLISGLTPTVASGGSFTLETSGGTPVLTDGAIGVSGNGNGTPDANNNSTAAGFVSCGGWTGAGNTLIYTLTNSADVSDIEVYSGWGDGGRFGQYYDLSYSTVWAPSTWIPITTVFSLPGNANGNATSLRVAIAKANGDLLGSSVGKIKFDFNAPPNSGGFNNGWQGYSEIVVRGANTTLPPSPYLTQDISPSYVETVVGDKVVFTAAFSNTPPVNLQWQHISGGVTNDVAGATTTTLTLDNVQLTDAGSYQLKAVNVNDALAHPSYSLAAPLAVSSLPDPINNVVIAASGQVGLGPISDFNTTTNFTPTWTVNTSGDLILGSIDTIALGQVGVYTPMVNAGNFGLANCYGDPAVLSDGVSGSLTYDTTYGGNEFLDSCGPYSTVQGANYAGISVYYTLDTSAAVNGFDVTNIVVYGGWGSSANNEQRYQVLYSTVGAPNTFIPMTGWVDYLPTNSSGYQSATRTVLTPATGTLANNVYAVQINFNSQNPVPKNNYSGYSEIIVAGQVAPARPYLTQDISPAAAEDVVGSQLTFAPTFQNATSYQWLKNGTNLPGATLSTLTLTNLQLTDTATNGGYRLMAKNANGTNLSSSCTVYVDPAPTPANNVITAFAFQSSSAAGFGPTWDTTLLGSSLIAGQNPPAGGSDTASRFIGGGDLATGLPALTDGNYGTFAPDGTHPAFAAGGPGAGNYVIYTLGTDPNGYSVTNIQVAGGWNDSGRDSLDYTILYSTVENPNNFIPLVTVATNLSAGNGKAAPAAGVPTTVRSTITSPSGVLANNVYAIQVNFEFPHDVPNGYSGYSEISVLGLPTATAPAAGPVVIGTHDTNSPSVLTLATPNLIANLLPSAIGSNGTNGPGIFTEEGCNVTNLTDSIIGSGSAYGASCGADGTAVPWLVFTPTNGYWNLTNIVVYTMWNDYGRCGQWYNLSYSTTSNPALFLPLASVGYNPFVPEDGTHSANQVQIAPPMGQSMLASNVAAVKFDFSPQGALNYGWSGYAEIVLQGTNVPVAVVVPTLPTTFAPSYLSADGKIILTGSGGSPAGHAYMWLSTTDLSAPVTWTTNFTGNLDSAGAFSNAIPVNVTNRSVFLRFMMP